MSIPSWARKGAQVVCVKPDNGWVHRGWLGEDEECCGPRPGDICTVVGHRFDNRDGWLLILEEWPVTTLWYRDGYTICDFRPLVEDTTSDEVEARLFHAKGLTHHSKKPFPVEGERA